jgi:hypothetical protein
MEAGDGLDRLAVGDGQDDARPLDGGEREDAAVSELPQEGAVGRLEREGARLAATHGNNLRRPARVTPMITPSSIPCRTYAAKH